METGFLNFHDEEHFTSTVPPQNISGLVRDGSLFGSGISDYGMESFASWDQGFSVGQIKVEPVNEDYEKTFKEWNQHIKELGDGGELADILGTTICPLTGNKLEPDLTLVKQEILDHDPVGISALKDDLKFTLPSGTLDLNLVVKDEDLVPNLGFELESINPMEVKNEIINPVLKQEVLPDNVNLKNETIDSPEIHGQVIQLEAGDVNTLLEKFEAEIVPQQVVEESKIKQEVQIVESNPCEATNSSQQVSPQLSKSVWEICEDDIAQETEEDPKGKTPIIKGSTTVPIQEPEQASTSANKSIKDALPKEVIERIRESCKKRKQKANSSAAASPQSLSTDIPDGKSEEFSEWVEDHDYCWSVSSRRDSGLESGELSDSGGEGRRPNNTPAQPSDRDTKRDGKKKKLKLEEYRERRKNAAPLPPLRPRAYPIPSAEKAPTAKSTPVETPAPVTPPTESRTHEDEDKPPMISVEVQTEVKKEEKLSDELQKKKEEWLRTMRPTYQRRSTSSSSRESSPDTPRGRRRARRYSGRYSRSRGRSKGGRSWSRSSYSSTSSSSSSSSRSSRSRSRSRQSSRHRGKRSFCKSRSRTRVNGNSVEEMGERRVVYVGQIEEGVTKQRLRDRFSRFGSITAVSLHFRDRGDNYGFVTFKRACDAYQAVEHGNDYGLMPHYDICFGGRRAFCKQRYADLDNMGSSYPMIGGPQSRQLNSFDLLLRQAQENLRKRSANTSL